MQLDLQETMTRINAAIHAMGATMLVAVDSKQDPKEIKIWVFHPGLDLIESMGTIEIVKHMAESGKFFPKNEAHPKMVGIIWLQVGEPPTAFMILDHPAMEAFRGMTASVFGTPSESGVFDAASGNEAISAGGIPTCEKLN